MSVKYHVTGRQLAAGRVLAGLSQQSIADAAKVSIATLRRMEASIGVPGAMPNNVDSVQRTLEALGILFTNERGRLAVSVGESRTSTYTLDNI